LEHRVTSFNNGNVARNRLAPRNYLSVGGSRRKRGEEVPAFRYTALMRSADDSLIWERIAAPAFSDITPDAAKSILRMRFETAQIRRIHTLSNQSKKRSLSPSERAELDVYLRFGHVLTLLHSRARMSLKSSLPKRRKS